MSSKTTIEDHEIDGWLGEAASQLTAAERAELGRLLSAYHATQEGRDGDAAEHAELDNAARTAIFDQVMGELDVAARGRAYRAAQRAAYAGAIVATLAGMSEVQAAREATLTRRTLRLSMGKPN